MVQAAFTAATAAVAAVGEKLTASLAFWGFRRVVVLDVDQSPFSTVCLTDITAVAFGQFKETFPATDWFIFSVLFARALLALSADATVRKDVAFETLGTHFVQGAERAVPRDQRVALLGGGALHCLADFSRAKLAFAFHHVVWAIVVRGALLVFHDLNHVLKVVGKVRVTRASKRGDRNVRTIFRRTNGAREIFDKLELILPAIYADGTGTVEQKCNVGRGAARTVVVTHRHDDRIDRIGVLGAGEHLVLDIVKVSERLVCKETVVVLLVLEYLSRQTLQHVRL